MKSKVYKKRFDPFLNFFKNESASGLILLFCSIIAIIIANTSTATTYNNILHTYI